MAELNLVQNDLRNLYMQTANQEAKIRELVRILNISLPEAKYAPGPLDNTSIPEHHRLIHVEEEEETMMSSLKGWVWSAIDFILPEVEDTEHKKSHGSPIVNNTVAVNGSVHRSTPNFTTAVPQPKTPPPSSSSSSKDSKDKSAMTMTGPLELANPSSLQDKIEKR